MQSLWMVLASLLFACMGVCVKLAAATHSAVEIVFYRSFLSLILMYALVRLRGVSLRTPHWRWQVSRGVVGFSALFAYFWALTLLPLATAVTLNYTSAIFLAICLALSGQRLTGGILGALALGLAGVGLLLKPSAARRPTGRWPDRPGFRGTRRHRVFQRSRTGLTRRTGDAHGLLLFARVIGIAAASGC
jgi:drug/metabolite transporter (DMT)-like permease